MPGHSRTNLHQLILLCATLLRLSESDFPGIQVHELQPWVRVVARYSFTLTATTTLLEG